MTEDFSAPVWAVLATVVVLLALVAAALVVARRSRSRTRAALTAARADAEALQVQVDAIERRLTQAAEAAQARATVEGREYVITRLGGPDDDVDISDDATVRVPAVPTALFADLVLREGVVQAASLAAGLRRALAPEVRHRIRFEMKREVKRARKQRRADVRQARRDVEARQRAGATV